jgi:hypothetical protein
MPRRRRTTPQIGTASFTPLDVPVDTSIEDLVPDPTTGLLPQQEEELEGTPEIKPRTRKRGASAGRK